MPTYDFACQECGHRFSQYLAIADKDKARCPKCAGAKVTQLFTGFLQLRRGGAGESQGSGCSGASCSGCSGC